MKRTVVTMWICVVGMFLGASAIVWGGAMGTAFLYQGRLTDQGSPANGSYDFVFRLYDASSGVNLLGTDTATNVTPQDGYFKAELDFGSGVFTGEARWLEIDVASAGSGSYTTLSPRQEMTPTPYALYALNGPGSSGFWAANGNDIYNSNSGNVGIGTASPAGKLHVGTAAIYGDIIFYDAGFGQNDLSVDPDSAYTDIIDRVYIVEVTDASSDPDKFKWSDDLGITWSAELAMSTSWYNLNHGVRIKWDDINGHDDGGVSYGDTWIWGVISSNENALVVKAGKLVGIGTSNPIWELEVANLPAGGGAESGVAANDARGAIAAYSSTFPAPFDHYAGRVSLYSDGATMGLDLRADGSGGDMRFYTGGLWPANERMRITSTGGTYITSYRGDGLGSWEEGLYFANNSNLMGPWSHAGIWADGVSGYNGELVFGVDGDGINNLDGIQEAMRIDKSGNVGIGITTPGYPLDVRGGQSNYLGYFYNNNNSSGSAFGIYAEGDAYDTGTGSGRGGIFIGIGGSTGGDTYGTVNSAYAYGSATAYGVYSDADGGTTTGREYAFYGYGDGSFSGTVSKGGGSFKIDHPLDPQNKYLYHSFVESPDMMNVYNGNIILDGNGEATVDMPDWFDALNRDFRYQLTCIGGFAPVYIAAKISNNSFIIAGGTPGMEVSWQVTGIRQDAFANDNRIPVEEDKQGIEQGTYLHPEAFGMSEEMSLHKVHEAEMMSKKKEDN